MAQGVEEIWNQKQLAKAVGTAVASARVAGQSRDLASIEASLRIAEGLRAKNLRDGLQAWLQQFHGADFCFEADGQGATLISLTEDGATKYQVRDQLAAESVATAEHAVANATDADRAQRQAVFSQLAAVAHFLIFGCFQKTNEQIYF